MLRTARERTRELACENTRQVQAMLGSLLREAGWSERQFLDSMVRDVSRRGGKARWTTGC